MGLCPRWARGPQSVAKARARSSNTRFRKAMGAASAIETAIALRETRTLDFTDSSLRTVRLAPSATHVNVVNGIDTAVYPASMTGAV